MSARPSPGERVAQVTDADQSLLNAGQDDGAGPTLGGPRRPTRRVDQAARRSGPRRSSERVDVGAAELTGPMRQHRDVARSPPAVRDHELGQRCFDAGEAVVLQRGDAAEDGSRWATQDRDPVLLAGRQRPVVKHEYAASGPTPSLSRDLGTYVRSPEQCLGLGGSQDPGLVLGDRVRRRGCVRHIPQSWRVAALAGRSARICGQPFT
jgi:hypothetical protein